MINIINNQGLILELDPNTSIAVDRNNFLFSDGDKLLQDVTYAARAGLTPNNRIFIQSGHLAEADAKLYKLPCKVLVSGQPFYAGVFAYKITNNQIEFTLQVNFGTISKLVKLIRLNELYTNDALPPYTVSAEFEAYMKATCVTPENYPHVFFPVANNAWSTNGGGLPLMNNWDIASQQFDIIPSLVGTKTIQVPFYRLSYVLKKIFECLGFDATGGYFEETISKNQYLYTRTGAVIQNNSAMSYHLPAITISDFLKLVADRLKLSFEFDLLNKKVIIETPNSVLNSRVFNDITNYVTSIKEISVNEKQGYTVTLKVDEDDATMNSGTPENPLYRPLYKLVVGDGGNNIEVDFSSLKNGVGTGYIFPACSQSFKVPFLPYELDTWQLKLLEYTGMKSIGGGNFWPEARPVELNDSDALWYRFLNDSKKVKIEAAIPVLMLSEMKASQKIKFKSKEGAMLFAVPEKISYNLSNRKTEYINVSITARTLVTSYSTNYNIEKITDQADIFGTIRYKAYFDPDIHGISEVEALRIATIGTETFTSTTVTVPTDIRGMGGEVGLITPLIFNNDPVGNSQLRVYNLTPKYVVGGGRRFDFLPGAGFYYIQLTQQIFTDPLPLWIVF
jgi:hypothetical protein